MERLQPLREPETQYTGKQKWRPRYERVIPGGGSPDTPNISRAQSGSIPTSHPHSEPLAPSRLPHQQCSKPTCQGTRVVERVVGPSGWKVWGGDQHREGRGEAGRLQLAIAHSVAAVKTIVDSGSGGAHLRYGPNAYTIGQLLEVVVGKGPPVTPGWSTRELQRAMRGRDSGAAPETGLRSSNSSI